MMSKEWETAQTEFRRNVVAETVLCLRDLNLPRVSLHEYLTLPGRLLERVEELDARRKMAEELGLPYYYGDVNWGSWQGLHIS